jgi:hypothetical protein
MVTALDRAVADVRAAASAGELTLAAHGAAELLAALGRAAEALRTGLPPELPAAASALRRWALDLAA